MPDHFLPETEASALTYLMQELEINPQVWSKLEFTCSVIFERKRRTFTETLEVPRESSGKQDKGQSQAEWKKEFDNFCEGLRLYKQYGALFEWNGNNHINIAKLIDKIPTKLIKAKSPTFAASDVRAKMPTGPAKSFGALPSLT